MRCHDGPSVTSRCLLLLLLQIGTALAISSSVAQRAPLPSFLLFAAHVQGCNVSLLGLR